MEKSKELAMDFKKISVEIEEELYSVLEFWTNNSIDDTNGGFIGQMANDGKIDWKADKSCVLNTRILWTFAAAYRTLKVEKYRTIADRAYKYIINHFWDADNGGLIWSVDYSGTPTNTIKKSYAQGFGIYAFSEYTRATGNLESLEYAKKLYHIIEDKFWDKKDDGYIEGLNHDWSIPEDMRLSEKDENVPKSMNSHLHILEPYTNLLHVWPNERLKQSIRKTIKIFQEKIINPDTGHFSLFFEWDWKSTSDAISFGHDIEGAWLLHEAAIELNDNDLLKSVQKSALRLVDITLAEGLDSDGSVFNEKEGNHIDTDKHWWMQAEAMVGLMDAYQITNNEAYLEHLQLIWNFTLNNHVDKQYGGWLGRVNKSNEVYQDDDKIGFWKCPYHNARALMEVLNRIHTIA